ncbi:dephospho-CoA kinase [Campylobacter mucosalis]|uniref:dephospho-CoA kinase n=1 Tax=Campylobacter mucosalis TaxID=202 RepID=UPI0004D4EF4B|nr:dephospho-CoA kinase [Campylobacter mucosalis]KEA45333.1 dephospho-CoA kinase [Campylobacter mucosalis]QKF62230.1 dephospho-CoA kinase [Campylobacter mucosalis]
MSNFKNAYVVTGSIGSGKSTFVNLLKERGFSVIDADLIAHEQLENSQDEVVLHFGSEILTDKKVDRKKLGSIVFNDKNELKWLENLLHLKIKSEIQRQCEIYESYAKPYFVDIPLFFEKQKNYDFDKIIVVYAPKNLLISRVMSRNSLDFIAAKNRVELQMDIEKKRELADFVIDNSKDLQNLDNEVKKFLKRINFDS